MGVEDVLDGRRRVAWPVTVSLMSRPAADVSKLFPFEPGLLLNTRGMVVCVENHRVWRQQLSEAKYLYERKDTPRIQQTVGTFGQYRGRF